MEDYDAKFEEMKKFVPFLDGMIKKLETKNANNPRQAQLDKIRSLRDLLVDEKKKMKMENLHKCEQVLINLYTKVEGRDTLPGIVTRDRSLPEAPEPPEITKLDLVRNKLKKVVSKDTLPEIQRRNETEEVCTPGSKEPALFQRRPNIIPSTSKESTKSFTIENQSVPKRNYTRVLVSPEPCERRWRPDSTPEKQLFSRRSPRRSPRRSSPRHFKTEKIKSSKQNINDKNNINILLDIPQERLDKLSRQDLGNRILNCNANDVNIDDLRVLRKQILGELKHMGATKDISDKFAKKKSRKKSKKEEVEEGELSDSESEAIQKIYGSIGSISVLEKNISENQSKTVEENDKKSKIQISLVINSDKGTEKTQENGSAKNFFDIPELIMYENKDSETTSKTSNDNDKINEVPKKEAVANSKLQSSISSKDIEITKQNDVITIDEEEEEDKRKQNTKLQNEKAPSKPDAKSDDDVSYVGSSTIDTEFLLESLEGKNYRAKKSFQPNFYNEQETINTNLNVSNISKDEQSKSIDKNIAEKSAEDCNVKPLKINDDLNKNTPSKGSVQNEEIPLLNTELAVAQPSTSEAVSEIEILQALKNDILSESIAIPGAEPTPPLHQPKIAKVVNAKAVTKKTISIEKYKEKSITSIKTPLFVKDPKKHLSNEEIAKKQSLKLTEKECERFKFPDKLAFDSSDEETDEVIREKLNTDLGPASPDKILAPKSPEELDVISIHSTPPIIIPTDPVASIQPESTSDVDMRLLSPPAVLPLSSSLQKDAKLDLNKSSTEPPKKPVLADPRVRKDVNTAVVTNSPNPYANNSHRTPLLSTPSRTPFENDDQLSQRKHVYAPIISVGNQSRDYRERSVNPENRNPVWEPNFNSRPAGNRSQWEQHERRQYDDHHFRSTSVVRDSAQDYHKTQYGYSDKYDNNNRGPRTPVHQFSRSDGPTTPTPSFGWQDCPRTPNRSLGRPDFSPSSNPGRDGLILPGHSFVSEMTQSHPYRRSDCPATPGPSFGRSDCPPTPGPSFGRQEMFRRTEYNSTPGSAFGQSEAPMTLSHAFVRGDMPTTPSHPFGRSEVLQKYVKDPRLNRATDYEDRSRYLECNQNRNSRQPESNIRPLMNFSNYARERSVGRNEIPNDGFDRRREPSLAQNSRVTELNQRHSRDGQGTSRDFRAQDTRDYRDHNRFCQQEKFQRATSIGRLDNYPENFRSHRATSVGRNKNTLSVESQSGHSSFLIDTSVNSTFQEFLNEKGLEKFGFTFDSRKKRASSVGRYLSSDSKQSHEDGNRLPSCKKSSADIERTVKTQSCVLTDGRNTSGHNFVRARSMGRDIANVRTGKNFNEVKADLQSYRVSTNERRVTKKTDKNESTCERKMNYKDPRSRKEMHELQQNNISAHKTNKSSYSYLKNSRDPRMRQEQQHIHESKYKLDNRHKKTGIAYTNDNIASGSILSPGYGVKNYKIPKIKQVEETKSTTRATPAHNEKTSAKKDTDSSKIIDKKIAKVIIVKENLTKKGKTVSEEIPKSEKNKGMHVPDSNRDSKRMTRSSSRQRSVSCQRKPRKAVIDSESDDDGIHGKTNDNEKPNRTNTNEAKASNEENLNEIDEDIFDNSFTIDDLDVTADSHIDGDTMVANIDSLIEDLDKDLNSKTDSTVSTETVINSDSNTMLEGTVTTSPEPTFNLEESLHDISEVIDEELSKTTEKPKSQNVHNHGNIHGSAETTAEPKSQHDTKQDNDKKQDDCNSDSKPFVDEQVRSDTKQDTDKKQDDCNSDSKQSVDDQNTENTDKSYSKSPNITDAHTNAQAIVSTTESLAEKKIDAPPNKDNNRLIEDKDIERCSTPDSTINTIEHTDLHPKSQDVILPDSSEEITNEMNPDVTSTHDAQLGANKDGESSRPATQIESIGNLLSILKDKSKIKELISMLGDQQSNETEKLKKKLEKLSEVISNDDDIEAQDTGDIRENSFQHTLNTTPGNNEDTHVNRPQHTLNTTPENETLEETKDDAKTSHEINKNTETCKNNVQIPDLDGSTQNKNSEHNIQKPKPKPGKKTKRGRGKIKKVIKKNEKRITRAGVAKTKGKPSRELKQLQESIKEMFQNDEIQNATGIRMCRLAKLVDEKIYEESESRANEKSPVVVLQKFNKNESEGEPPVKVRKKPGPKPKAKNTESSHDHSGNQNKKGVNKPGPKSKTKPDVQQEQDSDPYAFETDSVSDLTTTKSPDTSDSESDSLASSRSFGSSEILAEIKKRTKRKRRPGWQSGVITKKKKKAESKLTRSEDPPKQNKQIAESPDTPSVVQRKFTVPDKNCYTDKMYCFKEDVSVYSCRLCDYSDTEIVNHYKKQHPHSEIPLSRLCPEVAQKAINQSAYVNFQAICKVPTERYVCRFCFKVFRKSSALETFFWHVVSMHTGEYKQTCPECINVTPCPFNLDIPPPPKTTKGQLIGYICEKCNFTQISLENLKTHVTVRHNDEQTSVCMVNLSDMTAKILTALTKRSQTLETEEPRKLRSSNTSSIDIMDDRTDVSGSTELTSEHDSIKQKKPDITGIQKPSPKKYASKLSFEEDIDDIDYDDLDTAVKIEKYETKLRTDFDVLIETARPERAVNSRDIYDHPHFKVCHSTSGVKEYVCCVNGTDNHYKTALVISMKKHVQSKHTEPWDGYCFFCKVIVTTQGVHLFEECLQHYIKEHIDNLPLLEIKEQLPTEGSTEITVAEPASQILSKSFISVRPINQLINEPVVPTTQTIEESLPKQATASLDAPSVEAPLPSPSYPGTVAPLVPQSSISPASTVKRISATPEEIQKYEEVQAEVMSKKHNVVLQTMMSADSLARIYKCAGRYCSFTSDSAEAAWSHASTHQHHGGQNALICSYCDFDSKSNASELVTHVFKVHGRCQYSCGVCFYRAVASQLVQAHIKRVHESSCAQVRVIESTVTAHCNAAKEPVVPLSRELAVKYYVCANDEVNCKYKTFIMEKFTEHLFKHGAPFKCSVCRSGFPGAAELCQHLKGHAINLYQCTWCLHGANNEADLLAHASARHPNKQPQAYLRTINSKDPGKQMVLPLAKLNKSVVHTEVVSPRANNEDPVREAERSIDLEKLIGSVAPVEPHSAQDTVMDMVDDADDGPLEIPLSPSDDVEMNVPEADQSKAPPAATDDESTPGVTPVLKTEPPDEPAADAQTLASQDVICLDSDSDDEEPPTEPLPNVIDLSDDDAPATIRRISPESESVFRCARCYMTAKTLPSFKRHINVCYPPGSKLKCAHCDFDTDGKDALYSHYSFIHRKTNKGLNRTVEKLESRISKTESTGPAASVCICGVCEYRARGLAVIKNHLRSVHNIANFIVSSRFAADNSKDFEYTVREASPPPPIASETLPVPPIARETPPVLLIPRETPPPPPVARETLPPPSAARETPPPPPVAPEAPPPPAPAREVPPPPPPTPIVKKPMPKRKLSAHTVGSPSKRIRYSLKDLDDLPLKPILDIDTYCAECDFNTKVRLNLVRHLQQHAEKQHTVPNSVPLNPVPHLETNEKHFDKMVNLASSSVEVSRPDKPSRGDSPTVTQHIAPEAMSRYPKYVPDRQRHTCGAKGCSYISVDQAMLRRHWEALHDGLNDYHCVHCPPYQQLDTSSALTAARILGHLKMHDDHLYACALCPYYHHKRHIVEKHLSDVHKAAAEGTRRVLIVREGVPSAAPAAGPSQPAAAPAGPAPTMDLKPWQCGLCKFKSLLRPEVIEHCTKTHNSKMQFKCPNCPFRTSTLENVSKHKTKSHPDSLEDVFYYYYREGSIPDEADGTPRWQKQRQKTGNLVEPEVKTESEPVADSTALRYCYPTLLAAISAPPLVDLSKVKKEFPDPEETIDELCVRFGPFCEPNGLEYKCPLCKVVMEDSKDVMESHLFEELQYRKWGCSICPYKAFHKRGLNEHMFLEHRQRTASALDLPLDHRVEKWVAELLNHQAARIEENKQMMKQQVVRITEKPTATTPASPKNTTMPPAEETRLEQAFGHLGAPKDMQYCCPKCEYMTENETAFKDHLETELNKIRWRCTNCSVSCHTYHEAQLHCKTCKGQVPGRPVEAVRDPALRASWVKAAIRVQKQAMNLSDDTQTTHEDIDMPGPSDNSLLVVRYEETIPTPEEEMLARRQNLAPITLVPSTSTEAASPESDDERLVIDEPEKLLEPKNTTIKSKHTLEQNHSCKICDFTSKYSHCVETHMLRHYNLKPYSCNYCTYTLSGYQKKKHHEKYHPNEEMSFSKTKLPLGPPKETVVAKRGCPRRKSVHVDVEPEKSDDGPVATVICLVCEKSIPENEKTSHAHDQFAHVGQMVVKCGTCLGLFTDIKACKEHHDLCHNKQPLNFTHYKMNHEKREIIVCSHCNKRFNNVKDMIAHHQMMHGYLDITYETRPWLFRYYIRDETRPYTPGVNEVYDLTKDSDPLACQTMCDNPPPAKRLAKKSTTKLPTHIAKKSTSKLPLLALNEEDEITSDSECLDDEYSFYGSQPQPVGHVVAVIPHDHNDTPVSFDKLKKIMPIEPTLVVEDIKKK